MPPHLSLPALDVLASVSHLGFLSLWAVVWNPLVPYDFFLSLLVIIHRNKDISGHIFFLEIMQRYSDSNFPYPTIIFLALLYTISFS